MGNMAAGEVSDKRVFYDDVINLGTAGTHKINKGIIEWPFEFTLLPSMPESVEGLASSWLVYNLYASVERPGLGWNQKQLSAMEHVRLVRTLGMDDMETTRSRVCFPELLEEDCDDGLTIPEPDKCRYLGQQDQL